ncbi:MAG: S49 family peptidase [Ignavibacteria bacterium]|nr:S49 family peptidase [Ignavibacteria bacterium]
MKRLVLILLILSSTLFSQIRYYNNHDFSFTPPGAMKYGLYGFDNPALLSTVKKFDASFLWSDKSGNWSDFNKWGLFSGYSGLGFGMVYESAGSFSVKDYRISSAFGDEELSIGASYGWVTGDKNFFNRSNLYTLGILYRPYKYLSVGVTGYFYNQFSDETVFEIAARPFGNQLISLFGDYVLNQKFPNDKNRFSVGASAELYDGVALTARYFENKSLTAGLQVGLGQFGFAYQKQLDNKQKGLQNIYGIRFGGNDRNVLQPFKPKNNYYSLSLGGGIKYQSYRFLDNSKTLHSILTSIDAAKNDPSVKGIVINAAEMQVGFEFSWELRDALESFKSTGKKVVIFFDRTNIVGYYLFSVADHLVMDPLGGLTLEGFALGRNYYKGLLESIGVGYQEWRFLKYKSAMETFSRESFSEGDREQRDRLVDEYYNIVRDAVTSSRKLTSMEFDRIVNEELYLVGNGAVEAGLVDKLARWDEIDSILIKYDGDKIKKIGTSSLIQNKMPNDNYWGKKPEVAVIYAIGGTDLNSGMRGRYLSEVIRKVGGDNNVKALVLRVDSPGGDALAADLVAEALKSFKGKKPIIVTQGGVAASGGYWVSMYADTILAAPMTVTGSIGVIGGWFYNTGLKEKLGVSTDYVKRGASADLNVGLVIPFIGALLPDRAMNEKEQALVKKRILGMYDEFVNKVATGRNKPAQEIENVAQGRVWSGRDGKKIGLIDVIGGMRESIKIAVSKAGLKEGEYNITEYPEMPLIDFSSLIPLPISAEFEKSKLYQDVKRRTELNGQPAAILPFDEMWLEPIGE